MSGRRRLFCYDRTLFPAPDAAALIAEAVSSWYPGPAIRSLAAGRRSIWPGGLIPARLRMCQAYNLVLDGQFLSFDVVNHDVVRQRPVYLLFEYFFQVFVFFLKRLHSILK